MRPILKTRINLRQVPQLQHQLPLKQEIAIKTVPLRQSPGRPGVRIKKKVKGARKLLLKRVKTVIKADGCHCENGKYSDLYLIHTLTYTTGCIYSINLRTY